MQNYVDEGSGDNVEIQDVSIFSLINQLCTSILHQRNRYSLERISKLRAIAYEILLKKRTYTITEKYKAKLSSYSSFPEDERSQEDYKTIDCIQSNQSLNDFEAERSLDIQIFVARLSVTVASGSGLSGDIIKEFREQINKMENIREVIQMDGYFQQAIGQRILQFLFLLQSTTTDDLNLFNFKNASATLLIPSAFTLHGEYSSNPCYPDVTVCDDYLQPTPKFFSSVRNSDSPVNPYVPACYYNGAKSLLEQINEKYLENGKEANSNQIQCAFTGLAKDLMINSLHINLDTYRLFQPDPDTTSLSTDYAWTPVTPRALPSILTQSEHYDDLSTNRNAISSVIRNVSELFVDHNHTMAWSWESLGCVGTMAMKPFAGESHVSLLLQSYINEVKKTPFSMKIVNMKAFINDLKYLSVGIQSDIFKYNESSTTFHMKKNVTIDCFLPATILNFVDEFLECGTCYRRLQTMISRTNYSLKFEGFMFKTLCKSIDEYLFTFRQYVFGVNDDHPMGFYSRMKSMMRQLSSLSCTLAVHPNVKVNLKPPQGSKFLGYLYRELIRLTQRDYISLMLFILRRCCHVYLKYLQKWIYNGVLDDPSNELFIGYIDQYRKETKHFYDKAYFIRKESVPGFFQGFEEEILQCGKYTMLLKAYKPNHPIFDLEYPSISVCLSFDEIQQLENVCQEYIKTARNNKQCSPLVEIRKIFEERTEKKNEFLKCVSEKARINLERWKNVQREHAINVANEKCKILNELQSHLKDVNEQKDKARQQDIEAELNRLRHLQEIELESHNVENINLRKRIEYYEELYENLKVDRGWEYLKDNDSQGLKSNLKDSTERTDQCEASSMLDKCLNTDGTEKNTDSHSCRCEQENNGDDQHSTKEKCQTGIVKEFTQAADVLEEIATSNELNNNSTTVRDANGNEKNITTEEMVNETADTAVETTIAGLELTRSISDIINCNDLPTNSSQCNSRIPILRIALHENRNKNLQGGAVNECFKQETAIQTKKEQEEVHSEKNEPNDPKPITEAERNRLKNQNGNFTLAEDVHFDDNRNNIVADLRDNKNGEEKESKYSDLERNRKNVMNETINIFKPCDKDPSPAASVGGLAGREEMYLNVISERERQRRKVLESEYNIIFELKDQNPEDTSEPATKTIVMMSDSSVIADVQSPTTDATPEVTLQIPCQIDMEVFDNRLGEQGCLPTPMSTTSDDILPLTDTDSQIGEKNSISLSTNDINEEYSEENKGNASKTEEVENEELPELKLTENRGEISEESKDDNELETYRRTIKLLDSNFKCSTDSPYIRLNRSSSASITNENRRKDLEERINLTVNGISVITLTEFLRKSIIIPLRTHLDLVNNEVMHMFLIDLQLIDHLRSLRNYFLLMHGEFGLIICDGIIAKMENGATPMSLLNYQILHSILDNALSKSIQNYDKNIENLSFVVSSVPNSFDLHSPHVLDVLSLSYYVKWPLNLLLNPETLEQYATIFRYLMRVRRISWVLERAYQFLKEALKKLGTEILKSPQYRHIQLIRHKLYHFVHTLQNHITANALQASWKTFKDELLKARNIEDIYRKHTAYLKRVMFLCMLNRRSSEFHKTIESIFKISLHFYYNLRSQDFRLEPELGPYYTHSRYDKLVRDEGELDKFIKYTIYLGNKIVRYGYQAEIGEFIHLINFNQHYKEK